MTQTKKFIQPVSKNSSADLIEVGDTLNLVLLDNSEKAIAVTAVSDGGRRISWNLTADGIPRQQDVVAVKGTHQYACPATYSLHDGPEDSAEMEQPVSPGE